MKMRRATKDRREYAFELCGGDQDEAERRIQEFYQEGDYYEFDEDDILMGFSGPKDIEEEMYLAGFGHFVNSYAAQQNDGWF